MLLCRFQYLILGLRARFSNLCPIFLSEGNIIWFENINNHLTVKVICSAPVLISIMFYAEWPMCLISKCVYKIICNIFKAVRYTGWIITYVWQKKQKLKVKTTCSYITSIRLQIQWIVCLYLPKIILHNSHSVCSWIIWLKHDTNLDIFSTIRTKQYRSNRTFCLPIWQLLASFFLI